MLTLKERTCVFAGGSGGDGVDSVIALLQGGMNVILMTHQPAQAQGLLDRIEAMDLPGKCFVVQDGSAQEPPISDEEVYRSIFEEHGSIDVIINNTGGDGFEDSIDSVDTDTLLSEVGHLLGGAHRMLHLTLPYLRQSKAPRVIFMTTVEGVRGGRLESYTNAVAKGAVLSLVKNSAARLAEEGITVNCIEKGAIERLKNNIPAPDGKEFKDTSVMLPYIPAGRMGEPGDLAGAVSFLASEEASYVTGAVIDVSGGLSLV